MGELRHRLQAHGQSFLSFPFRFLRNSAAEERLLVQPARDPLRVEFEVLNQLSALCSRKRVRWVHRLLRIALLKIIQDHLRFRQGAMVGLDKWNLANCEDC